MNVLRKVLFSSLVVAAFLTLNTPVAKADAVYQLTVDHCTGGCNPGAPGTSMGTVTLHLNAVGDVTVTVALAAPLMFVNTGLQETIDFNLNGVSGPVSVNNFSDPNFSLSSQVGSNHFDGFGDFQYAIKLNTAGGAGGATASTLSFHVLAAGLTKSSFVGNDNGVFFGVDVYNRTSGNTGPTGSIGMTSTGSASTNAVPEPVTMLTLGLALLGLGVVSRRSGKKISQQ